MKTLILLILTSCIQPPESFYFKDGNVYHVGKDTTKLDKGDLRILQIDSLSNYARPKRMR